MDEGQEVMNKGMLARDSGLLAAAQAVEHYEISRYGTLKTLGAELGLSQRSTTPCRKRRRLTMPALNWPKVESTTAPQRRNK